MTARPRSPWRWPVLGLCLVLLLASLGAVAWLLWPSAPITVAPSAGPAATADAATIERGRYLARLGNCQGCHTPRGGRPYAGGLGIPTPFGTVFSSNLTPSRTAGLGDWSADDFWRALHHGQSRDGRWLNPAFPYNNSTLIPRADSDALHAFLRSLPPVDTPVRGHELRWPYRTQAALKVWRALYFRPGEAGAGPEPVAAVATDAGLRRGAYLVRGLGHCSACHVPRDALGGSGDLLGLSGGLLPVQNWYAPSLNDPAEGGVQDWALDDIVALFQSGRAGAANVSGPMAEVVAHSTQHWRVDDLNAMARYLQALPRPAAPANGRALREAVASQVLQAGAQRYAQHCAQCHGEQGEGRRGADGGFAYPPLAGNRAVTMASPANLVQTVLGGGFGPATAGHPRPFGMPPFVMDLNDGELAAVLTHLRSQWGNQAAPVSALQVQQLRGPIGR